MLASDDVAEPYPPAFGIKHELTLRYALYRLVGQIVPMEQLRLVAADEPVEVSQ